MNKIENSITFKIKRGSCLALSTPETMKLLEITKSRIDKNKIGEKVLHLGITEVVLVQSLSTRFKSHV